MFIKISRFVAISMAIILAGCDQSHNTETIPLDIRLPVSPEQRNQVPETFRLLCVPREITVGLFKERLELGEPFFVEIDYSNETVVMDEPHFKKPRNITFTENEIRVSSADLDSFTLNRYTGDYEFVLLFYKTVIGSCDVAERKF